MKNPSLSITFLGGAGTVTGSKTLIEYRDSKILIDCGLFQGLKTFRRFNWLPLEVAPSVINAVILTHAHLDHSGYLPLLVRNGFRGKIYATPPTVELVKVILVDSAKIQEEEAYNANRKGYSKHRPAKPLYTVKDAYRTFEYFAPIEIGRKVKLGTDIRFKYENSGHILGSAFVELFIKKKIIVFSGDLGRSQPILLSKPKAIRRADALVLESTYGDRDHPRTQAKSDLEVLVKEALERKGTMVIPTFAIERAQEIMFILSRLKAKRVIPDSVPIYLDSPMGSDATEVMLRYPKWHILNQAQVRQLRRSISLVKSLKETQKIIASKRQKIIIAGSGMLSGGRALEYLKALIGRRSTTLLFVGFQAEGTRGKALLEGASEIKIHGSYYPVSASIRELTSLSGHADRNEILEWLEGFSKLPSQIFLNHGELKSSEALRVLISEKMNRDCAIPLLRSRYIV